ncbi:MAG: hypothetical protein OEZ02_15635 [Anaerolineae bacterium]|nr:hypothetical protein [Anaerolineae bacterium]
MRIHLNIIFLQNYSITILLFLPLFLLTQACAAPDLKEEPGLIAFLSKDDFYVGHIYLMKTDGSAPYPLNSGLKEDGCPIWSPDGSKLLFLSDNDPTNIGGDNQSIYIIDVNGENLNRVVNNDLLFNNAGFSPDGTRIAFSALSHSTKYYIPNIFIMNSNGTELVQITNGPPTFDHPAWSPDGNYIAVISVDLLESPYNPTIMLLNTDGTLVATLADNPAITIEERKVYYSTAWSPDGKWIAYDFQIGSYSADIYIMKSDGSNKIPLTSAGERERNLSPSWSPSGNFIVFESNRDHYATPDIYDLYVMDYTGGNVIRLTDSLPNNSTGLGFCPAWQPQP